MKSSFRCLYVLSAALLLSACFPEERIWWSPKGDVALVSIDDKLHLVSAEGELGPPLDGGVSMKDSLIATVNWLPDGSGFVCQRERLCKTWTKAQGLIPEEEAKAVQDMAPLVLPLLQAASKVAQTAKSLDEITAALPVSESKRFSAAVLRAYQEDPAALEKLLLALPEGKEIVEGMKSDDMGFHVSELCLFKLAAGGASESKTWNRSMLKPALMPKVSPKHDVVACLTLDEKEETATLEVQPTGGGSSLVIWNHVSPTFEWMPDGRTLVFMAPIGEKQEKLQSIHRMTVVNKDGTLFKPDGKDPGQGGRPDPVTLATGIMLSHQVLQVLPDGRVLFASQPMTLPAADAVAELHPRLYVISADGKSVQPVPTAPGDLPANLGYFTASPDGRLVAVVESDTDSVAVVDISTGRTQIISPPHPQWHCETMPAWKSATELTFAALHGAANIPKWMLWSEVGGVRCISEKWPAAATENWLKHKDPEPAQESVPVTAKPTNPR